MSKASPKGVNKEDGKTPPVAPPKAAETEVTAEVVTEIVTEAPELGVVLDPVISFDDYNALRQLSPFKKGHLLRGAGAHARTFEQWETSRQAILGG